MAAKTKKVILFIVEGLTDENALNSVLKKIFEGENKDIRFHVVHGDMTSDRSVSGPTAKITVHNSIEIERKRYGLQKKDIIKVIHLVDTDGAFVPSYRIIHSTVESIQYFDDRIESAAPESIIERNIRKSKVLGLLHSTNAVGSIPYYVYYFSRNLEHVLHNVSTNLTDDEKLNYADTFADKYSSDHEGFIAFISLSDFAVPGEYKETWDFIIRDTNSLHRYCNFHLLFADNKQGDETT